MRFFAYLRVDMKRVFLSRYTRLVMALTLLAPLGGLAFYKPSSQLAVTRSGEWIGNPTLAGAAGGTLLFSLLALFELDRVYKNRVDRLTDSIASPLAMCLTKMISLTAAATATGLLAAALYLPLTLYKTGNLFDAGTYWGCWGIVFLPALWMGCFIPAIFYQITRRADFSLVLVTAAAIPCFTADMRYDFILRWINPDLHFLSDMFGNAQALRMAAWNRAFWLAALWGLYIIALLCVRRYEKGLFGSFITNSRPFLKPAAGAVLLAFAAGLYAAQPMASRALPGDDRTLYYSTAAQYMSPISLAYTMLSSHTEIAPKGRFGAVQASSTWVFVNRDAAPRLPAPDVEDPFKMIMQVNSGLKIRSVTANGAPLAFDDPGEDFMGVKFVAFDLPNALAEVDASSLYGEGEAREGIELTVEYGGYPSIWRHEERSGFFGPVASPRYWQFATYTGRANGQRISEVLPVFWPGWAIGGGSMLSVVDIVLPADLMLVNHYHGQTRKPWVLSDNRDGTRTWRYTDTTATIRELYAADYLFERIALNDDKGVDFYYARKNREAIEKYNAFRMVGDVYNYCLDRISPNEPAVDLVVIQSPGPGEAEFSEAVLAGQWASASGQGSMAYQIIQQWWAGMRFVPALKRAGEEVAGDVMGELLGRAPPFREWNRDALTEYMAYGFAKERFGEAFAYANYVDAWKKKAGDYYQNFYARNPEYQALLPPRFASLLAQREREALDYYVMPLRMHRAGQLIGEGTVAEIIRQMVADAYTNREKPAQPLSEMTVDEFWAGQSAPRPAGGADEYFTRLYEMAFGQAERPGSQVEFFISVPPVRVVLEENGIGQEEPAAKMMRILYDRLAGLYEGVQPALAFRDFLDRCGLSAEDLYESQ